MCAHSLLTIGEALSCNYGNQRWVKIILHFLQCWYIPQSQSGDMRQMMERRREGRGRKGGESRHYLQPTCCKKEAELLLDNLHPWSSHVQSVAQRGSHQLPVQRSKEEKEVITNRTTQEAVVGMGAQQVACFNNVRTYTCTPPY